MREKFQTHFIKYVDETTEICRKKWIRYKNNAKKFLRREISMQQHLSEYFQSPGYTSFRGSLYNINGQDKLFHSY